MLGSHLHGLVILEYLECLNCWKIVRLEPDDETTIRENPKIIISLFELASNHTSHYVKRAPLPCNITSVVRKRKHPLRPVAFEPLMTDKTIGCESEENLSIFIFFFISMN